jgi:UDP-2-acetamido-3-amino-2,3-dideoxy-glucuronate N-acetyltransferase
MASKHVAVIGCGYWGKNLVRNFAELGALAAVADANPAAAETMAATYKVPARSVAEILADKSIVGVVIASSAVTHAALAADALTAGKHVLVEKPLALTVAEAEGLKQLAERQGRALMVGHLMQYHPYYQELKRMVAAGEFGALRYLTSQRLNLGKIRTEENVLWSFAPHDLSMILGLVNESPVRVRASGQTVLTEGVADSVTTQMEFPSGIQAEVMVSWLHPTKEQKLVVVGEKMMAVLDDTQPWDKKLALYRHRIEWQGKLPVPVKAEAEYVSLPPGEPLKRECQHFLEAIAGNKVISDAAEAIRVLNVLALAEAAMAGKERMTTETPQIPGVFVHDTAWVDAGATIGKGTKIWHFSHILKGVEIGEDCVIGQNVMIGPDVKVGARSKIQNNVSLYKGVTLEEGVFCGPSCVFTNVNTPRAEIERKDEYRPTRVGRAATIGANATIICGHDIGEYALIGAGAVITKTVPPHALMVGNPAQQIGWVSHAGERLGADFTCPRDGRVYELVKGQLRELQNAGRAKKTNVG